MPVGDNISLLIDKKSASLGERLTGWSIGDDFNYGWENLFDNGQQRKKVPKQKKEN